MEYCTAAADSITATVVDIAESRGGHHAKCFQGIDEDGSGGLCSTLTFDDYADNRLVVNAGVTEAVCLATARRKLPEL